MPKTYVYTAFGGPETQKFDERPQPVPGPGQFVVKVHAAGVNPADWKQRRNVRNAPEPLGREVAGVVVEIGEGVDTFGVGDKAFGTVVANGGFSEYSVLSVDEAARKPQNVSFADAATLPVAGATAYDGITQLNLQPAETLLIIGIGGGVGIAAAQIALASGVRVIGTASNEKRDLVESIGAIHVVYGDGVLDRVRDAAGGPVAALYDMVGSDDLSQLAALVVDTSRIISIGDANTAVRLGGARIERARNSAVLEAVAAMAATGTLKPFVTTVFPLDEAGDALALVESGHATGKVVLEVA